MISPFLRHRRNDDDCLVNQLQINRHLRYDPLFNTSTTDVLSPDDFYVIFIGANECAA